MDDSLIRQQIDAALKSISGDLNLDGNNERSASRVDDVISSIKGLGTAKPIPNHLKNTSSFNGPTNYELNMQALRMAHKSFDRVLSRLEAELQIMKRDR